jgi:hypothetical protein
LVAGADTFCAVEFPSLQEWRFTREDAERVTQPVLGVFGAESASIWPGWSEIQGRLHEWLPQTEPFVLAGANHALGERPARCRGRHRAVPRPPPDSRGRVSLSEDHVSGQG